MSQILQNPILISNLVALTALIIELILYRRDHKPSSASFRIEKVIFKDQNDLIIYYTMRKAMFGKWKVLKINGIRGYQNLNGAEQALQGYLNNIGFELSESKVVKEYG